MLLVLSITFNFHCNIWGCMCSTGPFQYRWLKGYIYNSCYYHHEIGSIHLSQCYHIFSWLKGYIYSSCYYHHQIGSIHLSHCYHIFPWLCIWDVCYIIFYYILYIHSGKNGNLFSLSLCSLWWVQMVRYVLTWRSYSFIGTLHHLIIIIVQTYLKTLNLWNAC